ncbi:MAG: cytidylate kinase-like family protein [Chloroflexota bacterium]|nr:cytidylate kinase-like family protein [Chloroflexota bacterium]
MGVVTVSRQYGAGGLRVAPTIAKALDFSLVDRGLAEEAARRLGIDPQSVRDRDERAPAIVEEVGLALAAASPEMGLPPALELDDRSLAEATRRVILSLAATGGYVILGRGSQAVLANRPDACLISLVGDLPDRVARIVRSQAIDERTAAARCARVDGERARYVKRYYGADIRDPLLYDCVLNTSRLGLDEAAAAAITVARSKLSAAS